MADRAYVVVPFQRVGVTLGAGQVFMFPDVQPAKIAARQLAPRVAGVAIIERQVDPETGEDKDKMIAEFGAVPPAFPESPAWTMRLN